MNISEHGIFQRSFFKQKITINRTILRINKITRRARKPASNILKLIETEYSFHQFFF